MWYPRKLSHRRAKEGNSSFAKPPDKGYQERIVNKGSKTIKIESYPNEIKICKRSGIQIEQTL